MQHTGKCNVSQRIARAAAALPVTVCLAALALPAHAADINVTAGTFEVDDPGDVGANRVIVDNTADEDATLKINSGVTVGAGDFVLNNGGVLINEGTIQRSGSGVNGVFGDVGMAYATNREGGTITVDDIGMWMKVDGTVLNTGEGTGINGRIGIVVNGDADVTNEIGAEINAGTGAGLYLNNGTVTNRSGATIASDGAEGVRMSGTGNVTNTGEESSISGDTFGVTIFGAGEVYNLDGASIGGGEAIRIGGLGAVENEGTITSDNGSSAGVTLMGGGTLTNRATGQIVGYRGIFADDVVAIDNAGSIEGTGNDGISAMVYGSSLTNRDGGTIVGEEIGAAIGGDITNTGTGSKISGSYIGAQTQGGATLRNENGAEIEGGGLGVEMYDGGDVHNTGGASIVATGATSSGVDVWIHGSVTNSGEGSSISGGNYAVTFNHYDVDSVFELTNSDKAAINGDYTGVAFFDTEGTVLNEGGAEITANSYGMKFEGGRGEVTNRTGAAIDSLFGTAIDMDSGGTVTNRSGGTVTGVVAGLLLREDRDYTVINTGTDSTIAATGSGVVTEADAIYTEGTVSITNSDGASISGLRFGAWMTKGGNVTNEGEGTVLHGDGTAIRADDEATIVNRDGAGIAGGEVGIDLQNGGTLSNESGATVFGGLRGVQASGVDITNAGKDSAITSDGAAVQTWEGGGSVTNTNGASMHGGEIGVLLDISTTLENSGGASIIGENDSGVFSYNGGIVTNTGEGSAIGGGLTGVFLQGGTGTVLNEDGASISGGDGAIYLFEGGSVTNGAGSTLDGGVYGIYAEGGGTTVGNAGRISGDVVLSNAHDNHVTLYTGSSIDGNLYIDNRATSTLVFDGAGDQLLSDAVTGTFAFGGILTKQGNGTWSIDKNLLATTTNVTAGGLVVGIDGHGRLIGDVNVSPGATLGGSGTIHGDVTVDGAITPGNSPGILQVTGDYTQTAGSTYHAEIDTDTGLYDQILIDGAATIEPGAILDVTKTGGAPYVVGTQYVFIAATNGVTGSYNVTGDLYISPFLSLGDFYDPSTGYLEVVETQSLATAIIGTSPNQTALTGGLSPASPIYTALANLPTLAAVGAALPQMTGELHPSISGAMIDDSRYLRDTAAGRLRDAPCASATTPETGGEDGCGRERISIWSRITGAWTKNRNTEDAAAMNRSMAGMLFGADTMVHEVWRAGLIGGYDRSEYEMDNLGSSATSDNYHLGFYMGTPAGGAAIRLGGLRTWHDISASRAVAFPGVSEHLESDYRAITSQLFGEIGYRIHTGENELEPFVNVTRVDHRTGGFAETGGIVALTADGKRTGVTYSTAGVHTAASARLGDVPVSGKATFGFRHASGTTSPQTVFEIGGGTPFAIRGTAVPRNAAVIQADFDAAIAPGMSVGLSGTTQLGEGSASLGLSGALTIRF